MQLKKLWVNAKPNDAISADTTGFVAPSANASLASTAETPTTDDTGSTVTVYAGDSGSLSGETFDTGDAGNYNTSSWSCDGDDTNPEDGLDIVAADESSTITCEITNTRKSALLQLKKLWVNAKPNDAITAATTGFVSPSTNAELDSTADTSDEMDTGSAVTVFAGDSGTLSGETFETGLAANYTTVDFTCDGTDSDPTDGLLIDAADGTITCEITNTLIIPICRTPGFWGTHGGMEKNPSQINITQEVIDAAGGSLSICGKTIDNTAVGNVNSALEAICVSPKGDQRLQLARQLTAAALNCVMSGAIADCNSLIDVFDTCNDACTNDTDPGTCIEDLDAFNNGFTTSDPSCQDLPLVNETLGLVFDPPGPAGSSKACNDATKNDITIFGTQ